MNGDGTNRMWRRGLIGELGVMAGAAVLLALLGPFGMSAMPLRERLVSWLVFAGGGYCCFRPVIAGGRALAAHARLPVWLAIACACMLAALPTTVLVAWTFLGARVGRIALADLAALYPEVLLVGLIVTLTQYLIASRHRTPPLLEPEEIAAPEPPPPSAEASQRPASFLDRLPPNLGTDLLALENEDHYIRAHTALGSALILMRMRDAVAELDAIEGFRTHRSWWVARTAVDQVIRRDRAVALRLVNGIEVPVARNEVPALRAAGWL